MIDLKPYGAFIEHTIRPLLEEFKFILVECKKRKINITEQNIQKVFKELADLYLIAIILEALKQLVFIGVVCVTALMICR